MLEPMVWSFELMCFTPFLAHWFPCGGDREHDELRKCEWRLVLGLCKRMQRRNLLERLHHQHEKIEIETDHRSDDVDPAPGPGQIFPITRENGQGQEWQ